MKTNIWKPQMPPHRRHKAKVYNQIISTGKFIYQIGDSENLRTPSKEVLIKNLNTEDYQAKIAYLKKCMRKYRKLTGFGRGITGVQIGIPERISVICLPDQLAGMEEAKAGLLIIINPKITKKSTRLFIYPEICMSANPLIAKVTRPSWIEFEYFDEFGKKQYWNTKDQDKKGKIYNRVFEHEIDHMDGIINIDLVASKELIFESDPKFYKKAKFEEV